MKSKIVHVLCEGQTEQGFVEEVLKPYLLNRGVQAVKSILISTNKKKNARGGMLKFAHAQNDLNLLLQTCKEGEYEHHVFTTMFDLYALPDDFPGYATAIRLDDRYARVASIEEAYKEVVNDARFIPYIQLHEFEALIFCDIDYLSACYPGSEKRCEKLKEDLKKAGNPELINDNPDTAPSKRIIKAIEGNPKTFYRYNKPSTGKIVTKHIGIEHLRTRCRHFSEWIQKLIDA